MTTAGAKAPIAAPEGWGPAGIVVWGLWLAPVGSRTPHTASLPLFPELEDLSTGLDSGPG